MNIRRYPRRTIAAATALVLVAAGCSSSSDNAAGSTSAPSSTAAAESTTTVPTTGGVCPDAVPTGSLTIGVYAETKGLDPVVTTGSGQTGGSELAAIYDTLMRWNPETGDYEPRVAESLTPDADFVDWTLKLRPDIKFGSGNVLDAAAVKWSLERQLDPANKGTSRVFVETIKEMEVIDSLTLRITLHSGWSEFAYVLADEPGMVPDPAVFADLGAEKFNVAPAGAGVGPYEFESWAPGEELVLKAKPNYWGGTACVEELHFAAPGDARAKAESLETGQYQVAFIDNPEDLADLQSQGFEYASQPLGGVGVYINAGGRDHVSPTADPRLRHAIAAALDPVALDKSIAQGMSDTTNALFGSRSIYAGLVGPTVDPERAKELVQEVKDEGWDGRVKFTCQTDINGDQAIAVTSALRAVGFDVVEDFVPNTNALIDVVITKGDFDLACWSVQLFDAAPWVKLDRFLRSDSPSNWIGLSDPAVDALLQDLRVAADVDARREVIGEIQEKWNDLVPLAIIRAGSPAVVWSPELTGFEFTQENMVFYGDVHRV